MIDQLDTRGLIFHAPLNDSFGLKNLVNDVAMTNSGTVSTTGRFGETGGARQFISANSTYIDTNFSTAFTNNDFTICGWIKGTNVSYLCSKTRVASPYSSEFILGATGAANFTLFFLRGTTMVALTDYRDNLWHFLAVIYNATTKKFICYLDMAYQGESDVVADYTVSSGNVIVGSRGDKTISFANANGSDMMIYSRVLELDELHKLYRRVS